MGASNELPESEELDALYDRFLVRGQVSPVSNFGLNAMLQAAADNELAVNCTPVQTAHDNSIEESRADRGHRITAIQLLF